MLFLHATRCTTTHGAWPLRLRGVSTLGWPGWAATQRFSNTLPSTVTSWAFFSSNVFFTDHLVFPFGTALGAPASPVSAQYGVVVVQKRVWLFDVRPYTA